jgi:hypothetical protein
MGIEWNTLQFLLSCHESGISFNRTMTLGRQTIFVGPRPAGSLFKKYGVSAESIVSDLERGDRYADKLFSLLGAKEIVSVDYSDFERATLVHDMNEPLPKEHNARYDFVFDGGTLEHIFNYPIALRSAMEAVKIGGYLLLHTPTNNYCGHGFYQFSPELFYRTLSPQNGFEILRMVAFEALPGARWYEVVDPEIARQRVEIAYAKQQILLLVLAKRTHEAEIFKVSPQQSDYTSMWSDTDFAGELPTYDEQSLASRARQALRGALHFSPRIHIWVSQLFGAIRPRHRRLTMRGQPNLFLQNDRNAP